MTAAVILAAGASRRLGRPKQTVVLGGETLVERAVRVAKEAGLEPVIVVTRPEAGFAGSLQRQGAKIVWNDRAEEGMAASIRLGIRTLTSQEMPFWQIGKLNYWIPDRHTPRSGDDPPPYRAATGAEVAPMPSWDGAIVMVCDQPGLTAEHLRALCAEPDRVTGSAYGGKVGVPAYFPASAFSELLQLEGDTGARQLLQSAPAVLCEALALDIDTEADFQWAKERWDPKN